MNAGTGLNGNSMGMSSIDCKAALNRACVHGVGASVPMGNDINESMHRELQNTRQNAAVGIQNLKRGLQMKRAREPPKKRKKKPKLILPIPGRDRPLIWED